MTLSVIDQLKNELRENEEFVRFKSIAQMAAASINYDTTYEEINRLHETRLTKSLYLSRIPTPDQLMEAVLMDSAYRSRLVTVMINIKKTTQNLDLATNNITDFVMSEYEQILSPMKTKGERLAVVTTLLSKVRDLLAKQNSLMEFCEWMIADIDKSSFAIKNSIETLNLIMQQRTVGGISLDRSIQGGD